MPDDKLTEEDKAAILDAFRDASLSDEDIQRLASGDDSSSGELATMDSREDLITAAASALEFVEGLDMSESKDEEASSDDAMAGFDGLLRRLEALRSEIASLQRGVVGVFAAQLLTFRGKVVELKSKISEEMVDKLKMQFFKSFIETTFVDIVDNEFASLEKELVDKIVEQTQEKFKEFAERVRQSEIDLRTAIVEQQDIVRSFMQSLEEETAVLHDQLKEKDRLIKKLEDEVKRLQQQLDMGAAAGVDINEMHRKISNLEEQVSRLQDELARKEAIIKARTDEAQAARAETEEIRMQLIEAKSQIEAYKSEKASLVVAPAHSDAEFEAMTEKLALLEQSMAEKRHEIEEYTAKIRELEERLEDEQKEKAIAEELAAKRLSELESIQDKITHIKDLEEKIYDLEQDIKTLEEQKNIVAMQREAYEKATRLMEKERDMALEARDLANERAQRYIKVLGMENNTKVLLLVDEVGSMTFADLGKALGIPAGLAAKHARELEKLGVLKIEDDRAISTLKQLEIEEGEVKVD
ncbi:MAG: hypothetical protein ACTSYL_12250 [Candidatus Thorarchaeota archaeon]